MSKLNSSGLCLAVGKHSCVKFNSLPATAIILFSACASFISLPAYADEYHYNNILIGDRAAGMGGAYTAISDDPSGLFYNPAGIAYAQGSNISVSANTFHQAKTVYKDALGSGNDYVRNSSALLPNFFGIIQPLGSGRVGFSYAVPDSILEDQNQAFYNLPGTTTTRYAINFNNSDNTYNFGPSYGTELTNQLSVGATLYAHYRKSEWISNQLINKSSGKYEWSNMFYKSTEWGIKPVLGVMWSPTSKLATGLSLSQVNILTSSTVDQKICASDIPDNPLTSNPDQGCSWVDSAYQPGTAPAKTTLPTDYKRTYPLTSTLGVAYFPSKELIVSGDFSYYSKTKHYFFGNKEPTWNVALGTEYYLDEKWALKGGIFTDRSNTPKVVSGNGISDLDHVDLYGGSLSVSYFTRQSSITFGSTFRYGTGRAEITGTDVAQDIKMQTLTFFLSASYFE
jgi:long-chain fatty acid transport protein